MPARIAKTLFRFACQKLVGECIAAIEELTRITDKIVNEQTAKSMHAQLVASYRRVRRATDAVRSLAVLSGTLPSRPMEPEDKALFEALPKAMQDVTQQWQRITSLTHKYPREMMDIALEVMQDEPKDK
jgi:hypothetical protein